MASGRIPHKEKQYSFPSFIKGDLIDKQDPDFFAHLASVNDAVEEKRSGRWFNLKRAILEGVAR